MDACKGTFEAVMIVSEPFAVAYGMNQLEDTLVVDIGAGTTDLCRMHGAIPTDEDQITVSKAGDYIDDCAFQLIQKRHPAAQFTINMVRDAKERLSFVNEVNDKAIVTWPNREGRRPRSTSPRSSPRPAGRSCRTSSRDSAGSSARSTPNSSDACSERHPGRRRQPAPRPRPPDRGGSPAIRRREGHEGPRTGLRRHQRRPQARRGHARGVLEATGLDPDESRGKASEAGAPLLNSPIMGRGVSGAIRRPSSGTLLLPSPVHRAV